MTGQRAPIRSSQGSLNGAPASEVTRLLGDAAHGNKHALDRLLPLVYEELRRLAHARLRSERPGHTLNTTALVHDAYLKLVDQTRGRPLLHRHHTAHGAPRLSA